MDISNRFSVKAAVVVGGLMASGCGFQSVRYDVFVPPPVEPQEETGGISYRSAQGSLSCVETTQEFSSLTGVFTQNQRVVSDIFCGDMEFFRNADQYNFDFSGYDCHATVKFTQEELEAVSDIGVAVGITKVPYTLCLGAP